MDGSVQTEQALLAEVRMLRARVAQLEQIEQEWHTLVPERERLLQERAEARANELALLEANRRMDEFLSIASHELRTPLTAISGNIQLARRRLQGLTLSDCEEEFAEKVVMVGELLGRADRQVRVQNRLVSDLLDISRIQVNPLDLHLENCDLVTLVRETVEDQRTTAPERAIVLTLPEEIELMTLADADRISQAITNYLTNALKYSPLDRSVQVCLEIKENVAWVAVRDQGPGLPEEELERLWQRFYRVPGIYAHTGSGGGLGLGLHICRAIIERHNGQVGVQSRVGEGTTFWFSLPLTTTLDEEESQN